MSEHTRAGELLTWMVNGTLAGPEAAWLDRHLDTCADCRAELAVQRRIRDAIAREPTVEFAPQAAFNRLWKRIEADGTEAAAPALAAVAGAGRARAWLRWAVAAQAAAILVLCAVLWQRPAPGTYRTVTEAAPAAFAGQEVVKAVFADEVRIADVKAILAGTGLVVAAGPSEAGVYTLVARDAQVRASSPAILARLRADPRVRFAEAGAR
jgi:anti-sigma factor RsiW